MAPDTPKPTSAKSTNSAGVFVISTKNSAQFAC